MLTKETAKQVIDSLPDDVTMDDIIHALYINGRFAPGEEEIRKGRGVTHEEAKTVVASSVSFPDRLVVVRTGHPADPMESRRPPGHDETQMVHRRIGQMPRLAYGRLEDAGSVASGGACL
jgi:hypothetical protein